MDPHGVRIPVPGPGPASARTGAWLNSRPGSNGIHLDDDRFQHPGILFFLILVAAWCSFNSAWFLLPNIVSIRPFCARRRFFLSVAASIYAQPVSLLLPQVGLRRPRSNVG